jgi:hypothetical protein
MGLDRDVWRTTKFSSEDQSLRSQDLEVRAPVSPAVPELNHSVSPRVAGVPFSTSFWHFA